MVHTSIMVKGNTNKAANTENAMTAQDYVNSIRSNVDAMYDNLITFAQFDANQRTMWTNIDEDGGNMHHNVLALLRNDSSDLR